MPQRVSIFSSSIGTTVYCSLIGVVSLPELDLTVHHIPASIPVLLGFLFHLVYRWRFRRRWIAQTTRSGRFAWIVLVLGWLPLVGAVVMTDSWGAIPLVLGSGAVGAIAGYASCADTLQRLRNNAHTQAEVLAAQIRLVKMYGTYFGSIVAYTMSAVFLLAYGTLGKALAL